MPLFTLDKTVNIDKKIVRKTVKQPKTKQDAADTRMRKKLLSAIKLVEEKLSDEKDKYLYITSYQELSDYVFNGLNAKIVTDIAIDTETTGLNCFEDRVVGFSLQRRGKKACYIPVLHRDFLGDNYDIKNTGILSFF